MSSTRLTTSCYTLPVAGSTCLQVTVKENTRSFRAVAYDGPPNMQYCLQSCYDLFGASSAPCATMDFESKVRPFKGK